MACGRIYSASLASEMTDSGHGSQPPPDPEQPTVPDWAPAAPAAPPAPPSPDPYAVDATMRLIPVPHIPATAPPGPPPAAPAAQPQPPPQPTERRIGKYIIKGERGRGQGAHRVHGRGSDRIEALHAGSAGHGPNEPSQPGAGSRPRADRRRELHRARVRAGEVAARPPQPELAPAASDLCGHARRAAGARLCPQARHRPSRHEA